MRIFELKNESDENLGLFVSKLSERELSINQVEDVLIHYQMMVDDGEDVHDIDRYLKKYEIERIYSEVIYIA